MIRRQLPWIYPHRFNPTGDAAKALELVEKAFNLMPFRADGIGFNRRGRAEVVSDDSA